MASDKLSLADWQAQLKQQTADHQETPPQSQNADLVYSTDSGRITADKPEKTGGAAYTDGALRIRRETKGRGGKAVLTISGIAQSHEKLTEIAALLKKKCACGGAVKDGIIEIQGDKRQQVEQLLQQLGYKTKWAGG
ncbi:translation initiation factor [Chromatiaceae bacterium AAb-1]|nr:translation initiation factor [Chromatiaceae bacterium AAb-1]